MLPERWPRWILIPIGIALALLAIGLGLVLEPAAQALWPQPTPTPTLPAVPYARPLSGECERCHFHREALLASATDPAKVDEALIDPASLWTPHGRLGCVTCHGGNGQVADKDRAHEGLIQDLSEQYPRDCLICHRNLPAEIPEDRLRTPHGAIVNAVWEGSPCAVHCSDCHGQVGHGFDPVTGRTICSMSVCLDCHRERNVPGLTDCIVCHVGPHDVATTLDCQTCHTSTETWKETKLQVHPVSLVGRHAEVPCFACHRWPDFRGLDYVCSDCHKRPHEFGNDDCALCHTPVGWKSSAEALVAAATSVPHPVAGREDCRACHTLTGQPPIPEDHKGRTNDTCLVCHAEGPAAQPAGHPFPQDHDGAAGNCVLCHPGNDFSTYHCETCHAPSGMAEVHTARGITETADRCVLCHPQGKKP
ncbi:MAG: hypothetical protein ACUVXH_07710 [Anaerolineae bacterium]